MILDPPIYAIYPLEKRRRHLMVFRSPDLGEVAKSLAAQSNPEDFEVLATRPATDYSRPITGAEQAELEREITELRAAAVEQLGLTIHDLRP